MTPTSRTRRIWLTRRVALLMCAAALAASFGATRPGPVVGASCPALPVSVADLVRLSQSPGPLAKAFALGVTPISERALACFGGRELTLTAFVNEPDGIGGASSFGIKPTWIVSGNLIIFGSAREVSPGFGDGPFFMVSTRPGTDDLQRRFAERWVTIRGHFDDPAAATCRATGAAGATPSKAQAIAICRTMFVVTSIRTTNAPDTDTAPADLPIAREGLQPSPVWLGGLFGLLVGLRVMRRRRRFDAVDGGRGGTPIPNP